MANEDENINSYATANAVAAWLNAPTAYSVEEFLKRNQRKLTGDETINELMSVKPDYGKIKEMEAEHASEALRDVLTEQEVKDALNKAITTGFQSPYAKQAFDKESKRVSEPEEKVMERYKKDAVEFMRAQLTLFGDYLYTVAKSPEITSYGKALIGIDTKYQTDLSIPVEQAYRVETTGDGSTNYTILSNPSHLILRMVQRSAILRLFGFNLDEEAKVADEPLIQRTFNTPDGEVHEPLLRSPKHADAYLSIKKRFSLVDNKPDKLVSITEDLVAMNSAEFNRSYGSS